MTEAAGGVPVTPPVGPPRTVRIPIADRVALNRQGGGVARGSAVVGEADAALRRPRPDHGDSGTAYVLPIAGDARMTRAALRSVLASTGRVRTAVLAAEILGPPRALRAYGSPDSTV